MCMTYLSGAVSVPVHMNRTLTPLFRPVQQEARVPFTYLSVSLQGTVTRGDFRRAVAGAARLLSYAMSDASRGPISATAPPFRSLSLSHIIMRFCLRVAREDAIGRMKRWHSNCRGWWLIQGLLHLPSGSPIRSEREMKCVSFSFTGAQSLLPPSAVCGGMKAPFLTSDACVSSLSIIVHGGSHAPPPPLVFRIARLCLPGADAFFLHCRSQSDGVSKQGILCFLCSVFSPGQRAMPGRPAWTRSGSVLWHYV
jgi:hypothetical protein